MTLVVLLISDPAAPALGEPLAGEVARLLPSSGSPRWLSESAVEMTVDADPEQRRPIEAKVREAVAGKAVDVAVLPANNRRKRLLLADMDSTIIGQECIDEIADYVGLRPQISDITERTMRGELAFESALRERVALLKGVPEAALGEIIAKRITLNPGARTLVQTMRANGAATLLVSGGFTIFTSAVAAMAGFDEHYSNRLAIDSGALAGHVVEPVLGSAAKLERLIEARGRFDLKAGDTLAIGDGANDIAMLEEAGIGVAYHAKPAVRDAADVRIDHGDLTALLYLQGYGEEEFRQ